MRIETGSDGAMFASLDTNNERLLVLAIRHMITCALQKTGKSSAVRQGATLACTAISAWLQDAAMIGVAHLPDLTGELDLEMQAAEEAQLDAQTQENSVRERLRAGDRAVMAAEGWESVAQGLKARVLELETLLKEALALKGPCDAKQPGGCWKFIVLYEDGTWKHKHLQVPAQMQTYAEVFAWANQSWNIGVHEREKNVQEVLPRYPVYDTGKEGA